ncbi:MAG TPA: C13 family peptidase [Burkholderiaceae bacterium]|nr:C13 family peptidase [Burkholderiaceae bacterium]
MPPDTAAPAEAHAGELPPTAGLLRARPFAQVLAFGRTLRAGVQGALLQPSAVRHIDASVPTLLMLIAASLLPSLADGLLRQGLNGQFSPWGLPTWALPHSLLLVAVWLALSPTRATGFFLPAVVAATAVHLVIGTVTLLAFAALDRTQPAAWLASRSLAPWLGWGWTWAATLFVVTQVAKLTLRPRAWAAVALPLFWLAPGAWFSQDPALWVADLPEETEAAASSGAASEEAWARQPGLLLDALDRVTPGRPGTTELFHIVMGAYGGQDVFVREARAAHEILNQRFGAQGHGVLLANHASAALDLPFANMTNLRDTLATLAERMNRDEDVLFLYITTHGSPEQQLSVDLVPYQFDPIDGPSLRAALDEAGIRYRVVVLSACYAGGLLPALQGPDTAVFTAAAADRSSFGCSSGRDWTYFGEAFYTQGLAQTRDLEQAFELARAGVTRREIAEGQTPSLPQASVGEGIRARLRKLAARP